MDDALANFEKSPSVLQRYHKPTLVEASWFDFEKNELAPMKGRVRLCPYYFVSGEGDAARPQLGGVLATINPADKKIIHGMSEAILAPLRGLNSIICLFQNKIFQNFTRLRVDLDAACDSLPAESHDFATANGSFRSDDVETAPRSVS